MLDVMLDLESLGTTPDSAVIAIGAVEFDTANMTMGERFYSNIDAASIVRLGARIDPATVVWWMRQSDVARQVLTRNPQPVETVLRAFSDFLAQCGPTNEIKVWGNGPSFDQAMLGNAYRLAGIEQPWKFWNERCLRTIKGLFPSTTLPEMDGTEHNALDDAIHQVECIFAIRRAVISRSKRA